MWTKYDLTMTGELTICGCGPRLITTPNTYYDLSASKLIGPNTYHRRVWANSDRLLKKSCGAKCNEHKRLFLLKLFMQIKLIWHSKEYTYSGPHQWNVNIRILSVTTSRCRLWYLCSWTKMQLYMCIRKKYLNELLLNIFKELKKFTLFYQFSHLPRLR